MSVPFVVHCVTRVTSSLDIASFFCLPTKVSHCCWWPRGTLPSAFVPVMLISDSPVSLARAVLLCSSALKFRSTRPATLLQSKSLDPSFALHLGPVSLPFDTGLASLAVRLGVGSSSISARASVLVRCRLVSSPRICHFCWFGQQHTKPF